MLAMVMGVKIYRTVKPCKGENTFYRGDRGNNEQETRNVEQGSA